jgi:hypothetical protein
MTTKRLAARDFEDISSGAFCRANVVGRALFTDKREAFPNSDALFANR